MGLEQREFVVVSASGARAATAGDLPRLVLYKPDGSVHTVPSKAAAQAAFAGADITALKVELNAFLVKLQNANVIG